MKSNDCVCRIKQMFQNMNGDRGINIGTYIYPLLYSVMMAVLQVYFNMYINRVIVIAFIVAYNILAIYIPSWYVLGNMSMVYRSSNSVVKIECSVIVCCILIVIFTILTIFRFQKIEIIACWLLCLMPRSIHSASNSLKALHIILPPVLVVI